MVATVVLFVLAILLGYGFSDYILLKKTKRWHHIGIKKGYHIHHSVWGIAIFALTPFTIGNMLETVAIIGFGIGIIIEHTISDSFVFINKIQKDLEEDAISLEYEEN